MDRFVLAARLQNQMITSSKSSTKGQIAAGCDSSRHTALIFIYPPPFPLHSPTPRLAVRVLADVFTPERSSCLECKMQVS